MTKYRVKFRIPYLYEVEAENEEQAEIKGWKLLESDSRPDWIAPEVEITPLETE